MTAVLIGSQTYARRWVHYEVMKSIERGNGLLAIHINSVRDKSGQTKVAGPNPLDYLGIEVSTDGATGTPTMWDGSRWVYYGDLGAFSINVQPHDAYSDEFRHLFRFNPATHSDSVPPPCWRA